MLILTGKKDQQLVIRLGGRSVVVRILDVVRGRVRVGITTRRSLAMHPEESVVDRRTLLPLASDQDE
jgi:sRNA-binding carbon storage regulator CsrA